MIRCRRRLCQCSAHDFGYLAISAKNLNYESFKRECPATKKPYTLYTTDSQDQDEHWTKESEAIKVVRAGTGRRSGARVSSGRPSSRTGSVNGENSSMTTIFMILSVLLLLPYFAWGLYTLRVRYVYHDEFSKPAEAITVTSVLAFFILESYLLGTWMKDTTILYLFTVLGLVVSGVALYGPVLVSLASQVFVDMILPPSGDQVDEPQFAPAEALERVGDYEGAIEEYLVMMRIFPKEASIALHIANAYTELDRYEDSVEWFGRGLNLLSEPDRAWRVTNRLYDIYLRRLEQPGDALRILENFLEQFPDAERADVARARIERLSTPDPVPSIARPDEERKSPSPDLLP